MKEYELIQLLKEMSLEEKVNQMLQVTGGFFTGEIAAMGPMKENGFTDENIYLAGSVIGTFGASQVKKIQKEFMRKHPHHIPLLFMLDVINGFKTIFPIPLGQGAAFEPELSRRCAEVAAKEAAVSGIHVTFAPMTDLVRDARWGRVMESTGEDSYLNSLYCEAMVKGFQGDNLKEEYHVASCVKHFAGYGAPVAGRDYNTVELSEHTFREFYLPSYKAGIDAGAELVMTSFNTVNGVPATGNRRLMRDILREELGFEGVLISDWAAIEELIYHGYCADRKDAAKRAVTAGVDIDMMTGVYSEHLCGMVRSGEIDEKLVDEAVLRILTLKNKLGLFENPYRDVDEKKEKQVILCEEHRKLAKEAAEKSFVLLKNEKVLPINEGEEIAFIGPYVKSRNLMGAWSFIGDSADVPNIQEAVQKKTGNFIFLQGCPMLGQDTKLEGFGEISEHQISQEEQDKMLQEAIEVARNAKTVVLAIGEDRLQSGEATSNASLLIPSVQMELFEKICEVNSNVVVVLFCGRPLDIREISKKAKGVLIAWMPGTEGANALADVLFGKTFPSGKLPMSFPYCVGQVPVHYNEYSTGRPHVKGKDKDRFRSKYLDIPNQPLYPFGFGLSYTQFDVSPIKLSMDKMTKGQKIEVFVTVKNIGSTIGTETLQMYLRDVTASVVRPVRELKGYQKVTLNPGEQKNVTFAIEEKQLRFITENGIWESEPGEFEVFVGTDSTTENGMHFWLVK